MEVKIVINTEKPSSFEMRSELSQMRKGKCHRELFSVLQINIVELVIQIRNFTRRIAKHYDDFAQRQDNGIKT